MNGCYMDGGRAVFTQSALGANIWTNGFECCQGASAAPGTTASGITLVGNKIGMRLGFEQKFTLEELYWDSLRCVTSSVR
jgi:hypothetical protein